jgi:hypothetical protein
VKLAQASYLLAELHKMAANPGMFVRVKALAFEGVCLSVPPPPLPPPECRLEKREGRLDRHERDSDGKKIIQYRDLYMP